MGQKLNLLKALPPYKRNLAAIEARVNSKTLAAVLVSRNYGQEYFDGDRKYGYGGYRYDGRWRPVAADIVAHYGLAHGARILDIGCAKGFLVKDLLAEGMEAFGVDVSEYALAHCEPEVVGRVHKGNAADLRIFPRHSFDLVISINTIHNLYQKRALLALSEMQRLTRGPAFVQVDSYHTDEEKMLFEKWVLTAQYHDYPTGWLNTFEQAGYKGDYYWTVV